MDVFLNDLKYAWRRIARSPGFTLVAVLSLGLGIGANTAIFTLIDEVLLGDVPYRDPQSLMEIYPSSEGRVGLAVLSYPELEDIREGTSEVFEGVAATNLAVVQEGLQGVPETILAEVVTGNYFDVLGVKPLAGRAFTPQEDETAGTHPVVMLGHAYWQRRFAADPGAVGQNLHLNGRSYTIIGVAPPDLPPLLPGLEPAIWAPIMMVNHLKNNPGNQLENRGSQNLFAKGRLKQGVTHQEAQSALDRVAQDVHRRYPDYPDRWGLKLVPTTDVAVHPLLDRVLFPGAAVLMAVVGLVLLIACVNLTSFLLARASERRREIAIRLSLGAGRATLIRQLLTETVLLGLMGGAAGVALAWSSLGFLSQVRPPSIIPMDLALTPDAGVLLYSLLLSLAAGLFFGLLPAWQSTRPELAPVLKSESASDAKPGRFNTRNGLVAAQVAVSFLLLMAAGLFLRSLLAARSTDPGFGDRPAAVVQMSLPADRYGSEEVRRYFEELEGQIESLPGVESTGLISTIPLTGFNHAQISLRVDGVSPPPGRQAHAIDWAIVDSGYFETAHVDLLAGRLFGPQDQPDGPGVIIVSQAMAAKFWPGEPALGRIVTGLDGSRFRIVGVAADTNVRALGEPPLPFVYAPLSQQSRLEMNLLAATSLNPRKLNQDLVRVARRLEPDVIIIQTKTMQEHLGLMLFPFRFAGGMLTGFGLLALLLASIGLYGVLRFSVAGRMKEMGIRKSLGAQASSILRLILGQGLRLVGLGLVAGALLAWSAAPLIANLLFGVQPLDWPTFGVVALTLTLTALAAMIGPAARAARVDPIEVLRQP